MNRRRLLAAGSLGLLALGGAHRPAGARQQVADWTAAFPDGVAFEPIPEPTAEDRARVSLLASVTRYTWGPDANLGGTCFDIVTGGPRIFVVEDGLLRVSVFDPQKPVTTTPGAPLPATVFVARAAPAPAPPGTRLELRPSDAIEFPDGATCGRYGDAPVTFLDVAVLPWTPPAPFDETGAVLAVGFGAASDPAIVAAGRLRIAAGGALVLEDVGMPLALFVEAGAATLNAVAAGGLARDPSFEHAPSMPLPSGEDLNLVPGNYAYLPVGATGTLTANGPASLLAVVVDVQAAGAAGGDG